MQFSVWKKVKKQLILPEYTYSLSEFPKVITLGVSLSHPSPPIFGDQILTAGAKYFDFFFFGSNTIRREGKHIMLEKPKK